MAMANVAVGIPTFQRPEGLQLLLSSLSALRTEHRITIIIADNDAQLHHGLDRARTIESDSYRWPLRLRVVCERGISHTRNALIEAFLEDPSLEYLAMLDDDEVADPDWLDELLRICIQSGADIVGSRLDRRLEGRIPVWASVVPYLNSKRRGRSGLIDIVDSTGSILFTRASLARAARPVFDPAFGLTGGEDKEALTRLKRQGAHFAWADAAIATEIIPELRVSETWVLQRSYRIGNSDMRVLLRHRLSANSVCSEAALALIVCLLVPFLWLWALNEPKRRIQAKLRLWRAMGKLSGLLGFAYPEYSKRPGGA